MLLEVILENFGNEGVEDLIEIFIEELEKRINEYELLDMNFIYRKDYIEILEELNVLYKMRRKELNKKDYKYIIEKINLIERLGSL